jgi:hypothetical protein
LNECAEGLRSHLLMDFPGTTKVSSEEEIVDPKTSKEDNCNDGGVR